MMMMILSTTIFLPLDTLNGNDNNSYHSNDDTNNNYHCYRNDNNSINNISNVNNSNKKKS